MGRNGRSAHAMTAGERRATFGLAGIFALRMLGLFMILPVFSMYTEDLAGATPFLIGVALSAYGLTQALLQIPYGMASDRFGRIPVIAIGLAIFAAGSVLAAMADSIYLIILGRALQGAGAIAAAVMALLADLTREEQRTKAMALVGMSIGLSFMIALVAGPVLDGWIGLHGIFWLTAGLAVAGIVILLTAVPRAVRQSVHRDAEPVAGQFAGVLRNRDLLRLDAGILVLHGILTAGFVVLPLVLRDVAGLEADLHWRVYLPVLIGSILLMAPAMILAERKRKVKPVFLGAVALLGVAELVLWQFHGSLEGLVAGLLLFFTAFNFLEANLPSLVSRMAPADSKGTAIGVYSSSQFAGVFIGGLAGGALYGMFGMASVFLGAAAAAFLWFFIAVGMASPHGLSSYLLRVGTVEQAQAADLVSRLRAIPGVAEAVVVVEEGVAYLKIDRKVVDMQKLDEFLPVEA